MTKNIIRSLNTLYSLSHSKNEKNIAILTDSDIQVKSNHILIAKHIK